MAEAPTRPQRGPNEAPIAGALARQWSSALFQVPSGQVSLVIGTSSMEEKPSGSSHAGCWDPEASGDFWNGEKGHHELSVFLGSSWVFGGLSRLSFENVDVPWHLPWLKSLVSQKMKSSARKVGLSHRNMISSHLVVYPRWLYIPQWSYITVFVWFRPLFFLSRCSPCLLVFSSCLLLSFPILASQILNSHFRYWNPKFLVESQLLVQSRNVWK